ncbi:run domain Beclin-1-interacting and cysteine-rich domain-containing protein-like isoform X1 [Amphibalanus amphitrite]|uniref:run domain Beclin-1-interacting and cysteine-rich domain-containing protein-like isoform X1 n=1 Tax=Amphibalanus amphitrite TaxID=1232801 RepID=UPI001C91182B|nr:run domain Beclin-1-interacting and cysteine-rich domain-containing protein-like isoform X1 [Amphibalanus amphitrite]
MLPTQPQRDSTGKPLEPVAVPAEGCLGQDRVDLLARLTGTVCRPVMRRARSWPELAAEPAAPPPPDRPPLAPLILQIDYAPPPEEGAPSRWRRRYSERLTRRRRPTAPAEPAAAAAAAATGTSPATARTDVKALEKDVTDSAAPAADSASVGACKPPVGPSRPPAASGPTAAAAQSRPTGAVPKRPTHGRSQSATVPASVTAAAIASAVATYAGAGPARVAASPSGGRRLVRAATTSSRPPTQPAEETLPSPSEHEQLGFIPRSLPYRGRHGEHYPSFVESGGGHSLVYGLDGYFPKPRDGQSLTDFLGSHEFKRNVAELDRENAHFRISESLIAAFEMVGSEMRMLSKSGGERRRSNPTASIGDLRRRLVERGASGASDRERLISDTSGSPSSCSGLSDLELTDDTPPSSAVHDPGGVSAPVVPGCGRRSAPVSIPSSQPDPPPPQPPVPLAPAPRSATAENIALSLLSRFPEKQLPKASDLVWLVGEDEVPQSLLPMPSLDANRGEPDERTSPTSSTGKAPPGVTLRGTAEWAPPRAQIIFSIHKQGKRSVAMARQSHRCAGCGLKVSPSLAKKFRWCEYLGRYFCTGCHSNQQFYIPARIIHKHDYTMYPVSIFSHQLLLSIWRDPLFHVNAINASVLNHADLHQCRVLRRRLSSAQKYVGSCRFAKQLLRTHPLPDAYIMDEIDLYSLRDLVEANSRVLTNDLQKKYNAYLEHCRLCQLCRGRGFHCWGCAERRQRQREERHRRRPAARCCRCPRRLRSLAGRLRAQWRRFVHQLCCGRAFHCEACHHQQVLFPFEVPEVRQCAGCGACYHYLCYPEAAGCARCRRLEQRRRASVQVV